MRLAALILMVTLSGCNGIHDPVELRPAVRGVVYDVATQQPVAGVRIEIRGRIATTAPNGSFYVGDVPEGLQALTASKNGYATYVTDVQVAEGVNEKRLHLQAE